MRVSAPGQIQSSNVRRNERRAGASGFSGLIATEDAHPIGASLQTQATASVGAILALQQTDHATTGRKRAMQRATDLLSELEEIRRAMILGDLPPPRLQAIAARLAKKDSAELDPLLQQILQDIELRVAVELAKLGLSH
jgi:Class II flagellar assembly regulator